MTETVPRELPLINKDRKRHGKRKRISPQRQRELNAKIELARELLRRNWTKGDICRAFREKYAMCRRQVQKYLNLAYQRNCEIQGRDHREVTAYSIGYWAKLQRDCDERIHDANRRFELAEQSAEHAKRLMDDPASTKSQVAIATDMLKLSTQQIDDARRTVYFAEKLQMACQDRLDKITGVGRLNRTEVATVTNDDKNVKPPVPVDLKEEQAELERLLDEIQKRNLSP